MSIAAFNSADFKPIDTFYVRESINLQCTNGVWEVERLGFLTPDGTDKAAQKRKATVDRWASSQFSPYYDNRISQIREHFKKYPDSYNGVELPQEVETMYYACRVVASKGYTLENKPLAGFQLANSVRRTGWNGGNVVWRVLHPHGIEFEISSANLSAIISESSIVNGVIQAECFFVRCGSNNVLVPVGTALAAKFLSDVIKQEQIKTKAAVGLKLKDLTPGDVVESLPNSPVNGAVYLGKFEVTSRRRLRRVTSSYVKGHWEQTIHATYYSKPFTRTVELFCETKDGKLYSVFQSPKKPTILSVKGRFEGKLDPSRAKYNYEFDPPRKDNGSEFWKIMNYGLTNELNPLDVRSITDNYMREHSIETLHTFKPIKEAE